MNKPKKNRIDLRRKMDDIVAGKPMTREGRPLEVYRMTPVKTDEPIPDLLRHVIDNR